MTLRGAPGPRASPKPPDASPLAVPPSPPDVLPEIERWVAVHTRPRAEKVVARWIRERQAAAFLPLVENRRFYGARVRTATLPLFPGYLFCDATDRREVLDCTNVVRVLVPDDWAALRSDLVNLSRVLAAQPRLQRAQTLAPGTPVEVVAGPFRGTTGEVVRNGSHTSLVLRVRFLNFGAAMEIDEALLRRTDAA